MNTNINLLWSLAAGPSAKDFDRVAAERSSRRISAQERGRRRGMKVSSSL
ncbi:MAG: hypothetical protein ACP5O0_02990 [Acidimicrobiales bacterium]